MCTATIRTAFVFAVMALAVIWSSQAGLPAGYTVQLCEVVVQTVRARLQNEAIEIKYILVTSEDRFSKLEAGEIDAFNGVAAEECEKAGVVFIDITDLSRRAAAETIVASAASIKSSSRLLAPPSSVIRPPVLRRADRPARPHRRPRAGAVRAGRRGRRERRGAGQVWSGRGWRVQGQPQPRRRGRPSGVVGGTEVQVRPSRLIEKMPVRGSWRLVQPWWWMSR